MDIWETQYGKHRIRVELHYKKVLLFIDGEIADQSKYYNPLFEIIYGKLVSQLPSGELVVVNFDGFWKVRCTLFINGKLTNIAKL
ncbi:MAG: hypothetical protein II894_02380 [Bacteroidales bacterium]|nr:hypothetical protein [Bacteroidales bacterium]